MKEIKGYIARFAVAAVLIVTPIYYENGYYNTLVAKAHVVWAIAGVTLAAFLIVTLVQTVRAPQQLADEWRSFRGSFGLMDAAVAAFGITALVSSFLSENMYAAFTGIRGWRMGGITLALLAVLYFLVSRYAGKDHYLWVYVAIAATVEYVLGFLNGLDIDPLGLHTNLVSSEHFEYISTVGNINSYSGYLALTLPLLTMVWITEKRTWLRVWVGLLLVVGFTNPYMNNSDGAWLGICFAMLFVIYYSLKDRAKYDRLLQAGLLFAISGLLVQFGIHFLTDNHVEFGGISAAMLNYHLYLLIGAFCLLMLLLKKPLEKITNARTDRGMAITFGVLAVLAVAAVVLYNASIFEGSWGTKRGWIWMLSMQLFAEGSIKDKLVGIGPDCFGILMMDRFGDFISEHWGKRVANAHNEYIQYLVTMGLAGAVSYLGMYVSAWRRYVKRIHWSESKAVCFVAIMGYAGQALVNNPQAMNMAILFVCMGLFRSPDAECAPGAISAEKTEQLKHKPPGDEGEGCQSKNLS